MGEWWTWALVSPDRVAPSRMVSVREKFGKDRECGSGDILMEDRHTHHNTLQPLLLAK